MKLFWTLFRYATVFIIPTTSFKVEATDKCTIIRHCYIQPITCRSLTIKDVVLVVCWILLVLELELELEAIDLNLVLP